MNIEERFAEITEQLKQNIREAAEIALQAVHDDMMPHADVDAFMNAQYQAERAIEALIAGRFEREGDYVRPYGHDMISVRLKMTDSQYCGLRKSLLEVMPECPKDLEIASLKRQLASAWESRF